MFYELLSQMKKQLGQLDKWLETARVHAETKGFDANLYLGFRLAPDQFTFARQVQVACDTAKLAASRLSGKEAPSHADNEASLGELQSRVRSVIANLETYAASDFAEAATRTITQPRWEGRTMTGQDYFLEHAVPNFFFHLSTAYAILRHNGVGLGKRDYLGALTQKAPAS